MKFNEHQCTSSCTDCDKADIEDVLKNVKPTYLRKELCESFFKCFCETICGTSKRLDMRGFMVREKIGMNQLLYLLQNNCSRNLQDIDIPALKVFLQRHQDITHLNLANNHITDYGFISLLDHLLSNKNIEELDIQNNDITSNGIRYLLKVRKALQLKSLNLKANKLDVDASKAVALFLLENRYMDSLNVAEVNQTASSLMYFLMVLDSNQEVSNTTLKRLNISRPNPGHMYFLDSAHLADVIGHVLKHNTTLQAIHLQKYSFSCHDIESMMSNAMYNKSLNLLDLGCNNIGDHGIDHIAKWLMKRPVLKILILCRNIITDHGARSLSSVVPFTKLLSLDISYNKITDDGMVNIMYTLKKTPMLRVLKIFGNCIGHTTAKIVKRMLISKVLNQENIDVRPYRVDHVWYFARYEGERCKKEFVNVPYGLSVNMPKAPPPSRSSRKYNKYTYSASNEFVFKHSITTIISKTLSTDHVKDCKCCYCFKCEALHYDDECRKPDHPDDCTCCKCKGDESSNWSVDESVLKRVTSPRDPTKNIEYILKHVNSETKDDIVRWINIDKQIMEEDLKLIGDPNASEEKSENTASCTCSWLQINISSLQKYLQGSSSKELLVIPKDHNSRCENSSNDTVSFNYCTNTEQD